MLDTTVDPAHPRSGLAQADQNHLAAATRWLPAGWIISFETTDIGEVYARIVPRWNPRLSAFLIDREAHGVILTDNISDDAKPVITVWSEVQDAMDELLIIVAGCVAGAAPVYG